MLTMDERWARSTVSARHGRVVRPDDRRGECRRSTPRCSRRRWTALLRPDGVARAGRGAALDLKSIKFEGSDSLGRSEQGERGEQVRRRRRGAGQRAVGREDLLPVQGRYDVIT